MHVRASIEPLAWESQFFGIDSAIVRFSDTAPALDVAQLSRWPRVQAKVPAARSDLLDGLAQLGFRLVEGEVDFALTLTPDAPVPDAQITTATPDDIPLLRDAAAEAFAMSRFRAPWYAPDASGRFYAQWVENAVKGVFDHECLILRTPQGALRGFVTLRALNEQEARIGLLAGRGAGEALMQAARHWCVTRGLYTLRVATQAGNRAALRRYIASGGNIESTAYWLYR
ncbi:dTDP-4-amino-4,6-dideoxy-D-galactose acyltransferase [Cronobacter malonaticus]|uniref:dTDP-4-amino-4,6-dideoxy-D-galactose acyltransferase n=1 Tax=Cronobacter malonaticus TaxID=413503 RepID=UPI000CFFA5DF|nr:dTDP-4-amino-4,6-dideoxy-D-galactose acyltransferase [Cronobacter malonaticus]ELY4128125.1 dTDP-4-amino-4,6-dideoxy-D-galactose acyltransferase [Cronobacter malonaticus]ELY4818849.1 dTDP-4-amino-4,6-dideoxy-D-galactose acyltransferase [Cronobacter malonaticus]MEB8681232.1 dTDP-4-amino-4,6-dideoxy-D-galactose acyltransferase [Cronobacter malonaticus]